MYARYLKTFICNSRGNRSFNILFPQHYMHHIFEVNWYYGSLQGSKWSSFALVNAPNSYEKVFTSTPHISKVFDNLHMESMGIGINQQMVTNALLAQIWGPSSADIRGHCRAHNEALVQRLRLENLMEWFLHQPHTYARCACAATFIRNGRGYGSFNMLFPPHYMPHIFEVNWYSG